MKVTTDTTVYNMTIREILDEVGHRDGDYIPLSDLEWNEGTWESDCVRLGDDIENGYAPLYHLVWTDMEHGPCTAYRIGNGKKLNLKTGEIEQHKRDYHKVAPVFYCLRLQFWQ